MDAGEQVWPENHYSTIFLTQNRAMRSQFSAFPGQYRVAKSFKVASLRRLTIEPAAH